MRNSVDPGKEDDRPSHELVECDILVQLYHPVEWCLACQGDEGPTDGEQDECDIDVEYQSCSSRNGIREPEYRPRTG